MMQRVISVLTKLSFIVIALWITTLSLRAWDYPVHRAIHQLALNALPADYPAFIKAPAAQARILFLAGEADRWRNTPENTFKHANGPDHYMDMEDLEPLGLPPEKWSPFRYEFVAQLADARARHAASLPPIDQARNFDKTRELAGLLPWAINEYYAKLKSGFSYLKALELYGSPEEIANAQQNIIYVMGVMGHFVGDATQPLHTTKHFNGWVGENPNGYTTDRTIHQWIDGGFYEQVGLDVNILSGLMKPATVLKVSGGKADDIFPAIRDFLRENHRLVEPLYRLDKEGKLTAKDELGRTGKALLDGQLVSAAQMLANLWLTARQQAADDTYLLDQLRKRAPGQPQAVKQRTP